MPKNVRLIAAKDFQKLPKVQKIAQSGHTDVRPKLSNMLQFPTSEKQFHNNMGRKEANNSLGLRYILSPVWPHG